jgi:hypothetical protein
MSRKFVRQCITWLLALLLPLQAAAAAPLALCAALQKPAHDSVIKTPCDQMKQMSASVSTDDSAFTSHHSDGCWLGLVCIAGLAAFAIPMQQQFAATQHNTPRYRTSTVHYYSIVPDLPQRPPATP